jgi:hypothetical protein
MGTATLEKGATGRKVASYLVASYQNLKDAVFTIEKMVLEHTEIRNKTLLRKDCDVSIRPLGDREGYIVQVKLHPEMSK